MLNLSNRFVCSSLVALIVVSLGVVAQKTYAQAFPYQTVDAAIEDPRKVSAARRDVRRVLTSGGALSAEDRDTLKKYYLQCVFAPMTLPSALENPDKFPKWRADIMKDLDTVRDRTQLHAYIRDDLVSNYLKRLAVGKYHPACRYNATLILGMLNDEEARVNNRTYALPHKKSREFLIKLINPKNKQPEAVQIAALIGLNRHAGLLRANRQADTRMVPALVNLIKAPLPENALDHDTHYWKKKLAIDTLGDIGLSGAAGTIGNVVASADSPLWVRCAAAESIGKLDYSKAKNLNSEALIKGLGQVALSACLDEIERVKKYDEENPEGDNPRQFRAFDQEPEANPAVAEARRTLKYYLACVNKGLKGLEPAASDQTTLLTTVKSQLGAIEQGLDDNPDTTTPKELLEKIGPPAIQLEQAIQ